MTSKRFHTLLSLRLCLIGLVSMCVLPSWAADPFTDSLVLQRQLDSLKTYQEKDTLLNDVIDTLDTDNPFYLIVSKKMWELGKTYKDNEMMNYAGYSMSIYYYNHAKNNETKELVKDMRALLTKDSNSSYYFYVMHLAIMNDLEAANFEYAIANAKRMKEEMVLYPKHEMGYVLDQTWGHIHTNFNEHDKAIASFQKALANLPKDNSFGGRIDIQSELLSLYLDTERLNESDSLLKATSEYYGINLENPNKSDINKLDNDYAIDIYCNAAYIKLKQRLPHEAKKYIDRAQKLLVDNTYPPYQSYLNEVIAEYYSQQQDSAKAMTAMNKALTCATTAELGWSDYTDLIRKKAKMQIKFKDRQGAAATYARSVEFADSLSNISANQQYSQLKQLYGFEAQRFKSQKNERNYLLVALIVGLATLIIAARQWYSFYVIRKREQESVRQIKEAKATAEKANKAKFDFLNAFNDNIRTPLNAVVGFTDLMVTTPDINSDDLKGYATCIHRNSQQILTTVSNLLELSRMESNMVQLMREFISVENFVESIRVRMEHKQVGGFIIRNKIELYDKMMTLDTYRFGQLFDSLLNTYGSEELTSDKIIIETYYQPNHTTVGDYLIFKITGSALIATPQHQDKGQERSVRNTINRIVVERTGGQYQQTESDITITLPIESKQ